MRLNGSTALTLLLLWRRNFPNGDGANSPNASSVSSAAAKNGAQEKYTTLPPELKWANYCVMNGRLRIATSPLMLAQYALQCALRIGRNMRRHDKYWTYKRPVESRFPH